LCVVVRGARRERRGWGICASAIVGNSRSTRRAMGMTGRVCSRDARPSVVHGIVRHADVVFPLSLLGRVGSWRRVNDAMGRRRLGIRRGWLDSYDSGLGGILNDNHLRRQPIFVKLFPIRALGGAPAFGRRGCRRSLRGWRCRWRCCRRCR
jgi:hypothetical protein